MIFLMQIIINLHSIRLQRFHFRILIELKEKNRCIIQSLIIYINLKVIKLKQINQIGLIILHFAECSPYHCSCIVSTSFGSIECC